MKNKKIFWTIYITTVFLKTNNKNYINTNHLIELSKSNYVSIGSHGKSHTSLLNLDIKDIKKELEYSKKLLEDLIGKEVNSFSYPNGSCDKRVALYVAKAGYDFAVNSYPYFNQGSANPYLLNRQSVISYDDIKSFNLKITGKFDWTRIKMHNPHL